MKINFNKLILAFISFSCLVFLTSCRKQESFEKLKVDRLIFFSHGTLPGNAKEWPDQMPDNWRYKNPYDPQKDFDNWKETVNKWREINHWPVYSLAEISNDTITLFKSSRFKSPVSEEYKTKLTQSQIHRLNNFLASFITVDSIPVFPEIYDGPINELYITFENKRKAFAEGSKLNPLRFLFDSLITKTELKGSFDTTFFMKIKKEIINSLLSADNARYLTKRFIPVEKIELKKKF